MALTILLLMAESAAVLYLPTIMANIINYGIIQGVVEDEPQTAYILQMGIIMIKITLFSGLASIAAGYLAPRISTGVARDLRRDLFDKVNSFSQKEFDSFSAASLITRCTNDVTQLQNLANLAARMLIFASIMGIGGIIMALSLSVYMSWIIVLAVIVLLGFVSIIVPLVMPRFRIIQNLMDKLNKVSRETLHGLMVVRAFGTREHEKERFNHINQEILDNSLFVNRITATIGPAMTFILSGTQLLAVWVGAHHIAISGLQIGDMMAFIQYATSVVFAFMMLSSIMVQLPRAVVSASRITEVLETMPVIKDPTSPSELTSGQKYDVTFKDVYFRYPEADLDSVSSISFTALSGCTTAIIGPTGAGKSTIAQLLLRFYDPTRGSIFINNTDIRQLKQEDFRNKIGYAPQKSQLISGTISSNIQYGSPKAGEDKMIWAATTAQAIDFIEENPEGFNREIAKKGGNVSGGQRQRLAIARALAKNPEVLVFDDSFSALDFQTDVKLRRALKDNAADTTIIVIAQRVGTIKDADQIIVLNEGKIAGKGTHNELLDSCPIYYEIASSQGAV